MWGTVTTLFRGYMGEGLIVGWFLLSAVYLFLREHDKGRRVLFLYVPAVMLVLFFNPLFARVVYRYVGDEIYYRILWLLPITREIAYAAVHIFVHIAGNVRYVFALTSVVLVIFSGSCIYQNVNFRRAENLYHMPQAVVDICDAIVVEGREVMAVFPFEMLQYVRQYSPVVCMPYGREMQVERWYNRNELMDVMEAETLDVEALAPLAKSYLCHYVIVPEEKEIAGRMEDYDYVLFDTIDGYDIYLDTTIYIGL